LFVTEKGKREQGPLAAYEKRRAALYLLCVLQRRIAWAVEVGVVQDVTKYTSLPMKLQG
jgi:hypothetical protein